LLLKSYRRTGTKSFRDEFVDEIPESESKELRLLEIGKERSGRVLENIFQHSEGNHEAALRTD
jgi:hypothetical protein